jgi:NAD(P)H-hydrate epimerase
MNYIVTRAQMRYQDTRTIEEAGVSSAILMETAGARCADLILREYSLEPCSDILVICGHGNNGGDGMVIARHLFCAGHRTSIMLPDPGPMSPETEANLMICRNLGIEIHETDDADELDIEDFALIIDALYGIGFKGELKPDLEFLTEYINGLSCPMVAIDIPSGIDANTGTGTAFRADLTIAIEAYKFGHFLAQGPAHCGQLRLVPIGVPRIYKDDCHALVLHPDDLTLPHREASAHKGQFGRVLLFGGSPDYPGSIMLSAKAALKSGAGLIYLYSRAENLMFYAGCAEIMPRAISTDQDGMPDQEALESAINTATAIVVGPGMGQDAFAHKVLETVLKCSSVPTVIDADAIGLIARDPGLRELMDKEHFILTPHKGEFCRLMNLEMEELDKDLIARIEAFRARHRCKLLLKDHRSIYADQDWILVLVSGNDALATGGSGDVLSGIIASFAAQGLESHIAASSASLLMGKTAEMLCKSRHSYSVRPSDIIEHLGDRDE